MRKTSSLRWRALSGLRARLLLLGSIVSIHHPPEPDFVRPPGGGSPPDAARTTRAASRLRGSTVQRYAAACLAVALATALKMLLGPGLEQGSPFLLYSAAAMVSALYGGIGPGLLTVACSAVVTAFLFFPPYHSLFIASPDLRVRLVAFVVEMAFISIVCGALRSATRRLEASRAVLEAEVAERRRLLGEAEAGRRTAEALAQVGTLITQSLDPLDIRQRMVDGVRALFAAQRAALYTVDPEAGDLVVQAVSGANAAALVSLRSFRPGMGLVALAAQGRRPMITADVLNDPRVQLTPENRVQIEEAEVGAALVVPLLARDTVVGALTVSDRIGRAFTDDDTRLAQTFAGQAVIVLEHAQLYHRAEQRAEKLTALTRLTKLMTSAADNQEVFHAVAESATRLLGAAASRVWVDDPVARVLRTESSFGIDAEMDGPRTDFPTIPYGQGLVGRILESRAPEYVRDIAAEPRLLNRRLATDGGLRGFAGLPLTTGDRVVGVLALFFRETRRFTAEEKELMGLLADAAAIAIDTARLLAEERLGRTHLASLLEINKTIGTARSAEMLLNLIAEEAARLLGVDNAGFRLLEGDELVLAGRAGLARETMIRSRIKVGESMTGKVIVEQRALILDIGRVPDVVPEHLAADRRLGYSAFLGVPVQTGARTLGVLTFRARRPFTVRDQALAEAFAGQAAIAIEHARLYQEVQSAYEERSRAQAQLVRAETLRATGELAAGAAHHLNNLLAVALGRVQMLLARSEAPEVRRQMEPTEQALRASAEVVRRLSTFSRAHAQQKTVVLNLAQLAAEVIELTRGRWDSEAELRGAKIEARVEAGEIPGISGDPASLREVLVNLVLNAVEALPNGGRILIRTWATSGRVYCSVTDTGVGMSAAVQERAVDPFFTTKGVKNTGLGLSVNYGIIQRHAGELAIESAPGQGTTVTFWLPSAQKLCEGETSPGPEGKPIAARRILLIDDDAAVRHVVAELLAEDGHLLTEATSGAEGLARLASGPPVDLVLTDLGMPGMTGWEVARAIKASYPSLPVGLVTGWGEDPQGIPGDREAVDFVLAKPVTLDGLRSRIPRITT